ncbi:hypothetical protein [Streptomyces sp. AcH 505]|uniref:hypothetical protein n=1 Tax=Streptomyces sp. AcH 505 TaxID=352211 RepID=UPI0006932FAF
MQMAFAAHQPRYGHITVHPTPLGTGSYLAHDLIRALGKHLPIPSANHDQPMWINHTDRSWRIAAAWILTLGITHLTLCRAHRISAPQWEYLLALSARTGTHLTLLCNAPIPHATARLQATITHQYIDDDLPAAAAHWRLPPSPEEFTGYRWWQQTASYPPLESERWFRMPTEPALPRTGERFAPLPDLPGHILRLPAPGAHQDYPHPHIAQVASRIHSRIAHPVHAACVALRALTGYSNTQITNLRTQPGDALPSLPAWASILMDATRHLAELRGHPDAPNPLATPTWEHPDIDQALQACRLLPSPPIRGRRSPPPTRQPPAARATTRTPQNPSAL